MKLGWIVVTALMVVACGSSDEKDPSTDEKEEKAATLPAASDPPSGGSATGSAATSGQPPAAPTTTPPAPAPAPAPDESAGRVSFGKHCCFKGQYFQCPNANACWGGFDLGACLAGCIQNPTPACVTSCEAQLDKAPPPAGCQSAPEPKGIDCKLAQMIF